MSSTLLNSMYDSQLVLKDAGLVAVSAAGTVSSAAKVLDLGAALTDGIMFVDVTAVEIGTGDERYQIALEGSNSATFASGIVPLASLELGANAVTEGDADLNGLGRYAVPFFNERLGTVYRYVRVYTTVSGTVATGVNFSAFLGQDNL